MTERSQPTSQEIAELVERINELERTLEVAKDCLLEWDRVTKTLLYPHQHNTGAMTKVALQSIREAL